MNLPKPDGFDCSNLRTGIIGGAPVPRPLMHRLLNELNMTQYTSSYGLTEASPTCFNYDRLYRSPPNNGGYSDASCARQNCRRLMTTSSLLVVRRSFAWPSISSVRGKKPSSEELRDWTREALRRCKAPQYVFVFGKGGLNRAIPVTW